MAQFGTNIGLIYGDPKLDAVSKCLEAKPGIVPESGSNSRRLPPSLILQSLRQVKMVECDHGEDATGAQVVNYLVVVLHSCKRYKVGK